MRFEFTPGARRALAAASGWTSRDDSDELDVPEVLWGLLAEPECRSALLLAEHDIDADAVRRQFALLQLGVEAAGREGRFSPAWVACLNAVEALLVDYPRPLELATEHLLLGLAATDNEVSRWLAQRGLDAANLEAAVHRLAGYEPGPLPLDTDDAEQDAGRTIGPAADAANARAARPGAEHVQTAALRVIDAAANRAGEGLRVIEDYLRFGLDDRHLTGLCKGLRHELAGALGAFPRSARHAARDTQCDVGTSVSLPAEQVRADAAAVLEANFKRVEQALRSLEEFSKTQAPEAAEAFEQLRYRVYTLERAVDITRTNLERLADARLYVLVDGGTSQQAFAELAESLVAAGVSAIQLRDKRLADRRLLERARILHDLTRQTPTLFIVNDRPDLAVLAGADGVHLGQEELSAKDARRILGPSGLVGVSTHSLEQAKAAVLAGADYIGVGPTFPSGTKRFAEFTGPELLRAVAAEIRLPAFAIGGITADNLHQVLAAGFTRIAVSGAVTAADDPAEAACRLLALLRG
jgi:thiamine-phosphate pyrophosphorylase